MTDCNACTPQHMNPVGTHCRGVPIRFTVQGRGTPFVDVGPVVRHYHVPYLKYGAIPSGYRVHYQPVEWSCTCPDFTRRLRHTNCKHIMMCVDLKLPGHSGTTYPFPTFLVQHVIEMDEVSAVSPFGTFHQLVPIVECNI